MVINTAIVGDAAEAAIARQYNELIGITVDPPSGPNRTTTLGMFDIAETITPGFASGYQVDSGEPPSTLLAQWLDVGAAVARVGLKKLVLLK